MKILPVLFLFALSACSALPPGVPLSTPTAGTPQARAEKQATATIGWQSTAEAAQSAEVSAQATADAARAEVEAAHVAVAQITAQAERNVIEVAAMTQQAYVINAEGTHFVISGTATAAGTSVPLTATAQAVNNTAIANYSTQQAAQMTATFQAPTLLRDAKSAEAYNAVADFWVRVWAMAMLGVFCLATPILLYVTSHRPAAIQSAPVPPAGYEPIHIVDPVVNISMTRNNGGGYSSTERTSLPCTPEQFTRLCNGVLDGQSLAFDYWTTRTEPDQPAPFTRDEFTTLRNWMQSNRLAQGNGRRGELMLTADGEALFVEWTNSQELPEGYKFTEEHA